MMVGMTFLEIFCHCTHLPPGKMDSEKNKRELELWNVRLFQKHFFSSSSSSSSVVTSTSGYNFSNGCMPFRVAELVAIKQALTWELADPYNDEQMGLRYPTATAVFGAWRYWWVGG